MKFSSWLGTESTGWTILIRLLVGLVVFFPEGLQKLFYPAMLGAGRFVKIGISRRDVMRLFFGVDEIFWGLSRSA